MPANVETMMYVREKPWHGLGTMVAEAPSSAKALELAGLDWNVIQNRVQYKGNDTDWLMNIRDKDDTVLGMVTDRYKIVQNTEAFAFTDSLIGGDVRYETAGSLRNGKTVWMLAKMPSAKVAGDEVEQYMCFTNTHDGSGAVKVCLTPIRVVCNNTLNFALENAKRSWSVRHTGNIAEKVSEARECLELAKRYMLELDGFAYDMTNIKVDDTLLKALLAKMFPITDKMSDREVRTAEEKKEEYMVAYFAPDIAKFRGTAWGAINAMTDMVAHSTPQRMTQNYQENNWGKIMNGHALVDKMVAEFV